jgi:hypothetical protein
LAGDAVQLKPSIVKALELVLLETGPHLAFLHNGKKAYLSASAELLAGLASPVRIANTNKRIGDEMAIAERPKRPAVFKKSIIKLVANETVIGLGVRIGDELITCRHVVDACRTYEKFYLVSGQKQVEFQKSWTRTFRSADMDVEAFSIPQAIWAVLGARSSALAEARLGATVTVYGHNELGEESLSIGTLNRCDEFMAFRHNASTMPGDSGTPIFMGDKVVGIHQKAAPFKGRPSNQAICLSFLIDTALESDVSSNQVFFRRRQDYEVPDDVDADYQKYRKRLAQEDADKEDAKTDYGGRVDPDARRVRIRRGKWIYELIPRADGSYSQQAYLPADEYDSEHSDQGEAWADFSDNEYEDGQVPMPSLVSASAPNNKPPTDFRQSQPSQALTRPKSCSNSDNSSLPLKELPAPASVSSHAVPDMPSSQDPESQNSSLSSSAKRRRARAAKKARPSTSVETLEFTLATPDETTPTLRVPANLFPNSGKSNGPKEAGERRQ